LKDERGEEETRRFRVQDFRLFLALSRTGTDRKSLHILCVTSFGTRHSASKNIQKQRSTRRVVAREIGRTRDRSLAGEEDQKEDDDC